MLGGGCGTPVEDTRELQERAGRLMIQTIGRGLTTCQSLRRSAGSPLAQSGSRERHRERPVLDRLCDAIQRSTGAN